MRNNAFDLFLLIACCILPADSSVYLCWGLMDYVMIGYVSAHYGASVQVTLAVVVSLIEFSVVMDGVGMALQPLISTYYGEKNLLIERDSGKLFDLTDPDTRVRGLSGFVLSGLMESHKEKKYLVTTGYNRNMIRFSNK